MADMGQRRASRSRFQQQSEYNENTPRSLSYATDNEPDRFISRRQFPKFEIRNPKEIFVRANSSSSDT